MSDLRRFTKQDSPEARARLLDKTDAFKIKPGMTIHTILRHVSKSGMHRVIQPVLIRRAPATDPFRSRADNGCTIFQLGYNVAALLGMSYDREKEGIVIGGCGMDMGFEIVYNMGRVLFPKGFKVPKGGHGRNGNTSGYDNDGGYALNHRWL